MKTAGDVRLRRNLQQADDPIHIHGGLDGVCDAVDGPFAGRFHVEGRRLRTADPAEQGGLSLGRIEEPVQVGA